MLIVHQIVENIWNVEVLEIEMLHCVVGDFRKAEVVHVYVPDMKNIASDVEMLPQVLQSG